MVAAILLAIGAPKGAAPAAAAGAASESPRPNPIAAETLRWTSPASLTGVHFAWVVGAEHRPGLYALRVKLDSGARIPPHTHPDERVTTVLAGTLYVGFGERFDESGVVAVPAGAAYVAPAAVPHYLWAKEGEVLYQEAGTGPTSTAMIGG